MGLMEAKSGLVTGAAGGIGRASAMRFAAEGAAVVVNDLEAMREQGEETVRLIAEAGGRALFVAADVSRANDQRRLVETCVAELGRVDFAHNNAAVVYNASVEDALEQDIDRMYEVNLKGVLLGMQQQIRAMRAQGSGAIVNTASSTGVLPTPGLAGYTATKFAVIGLTRTAAHEVGDAGIRVNCVCPGPTLTPTMATVPPEIQDRLVAPLAIRRMIDPNEIAATAVWLASDSASAVTGASLMADLGLTAAIGSAPA
jgi:NAD(P)-dependent dehydrogenase (short-subunit alcohol dehydrogenase family)